MCNTSLYNIVPHAWKLGRHHAGSKAKRGRERGRIVQAHASREASHMSQHGMASGAALHGIGNTIAAGFNRGRRPEVTVAMGVGGAFDTLTHGLCQPGIPHSIVGFVAGCIGGRKSYATFGGGTSTQRQFRGGVPQGGAGTHALRRNHVWHSSTTSTGETDDLR